MHQNVKYPGVVYFRTVADVQKAVKILGKKLLPNNLMVLLVQLAERYIVAVEVRYNTLIMFY